MLSVLSSLLISAQDQEEFPHDLPRHFKKGVNSEIKYNLTIVSTTRVDSHMRQHVPPYRDNQPLTKECNFFFVSSELYQVFFT